jgi:hypothetical protein
VRITFGIIAFAIIVIAMIFVLQILSQIFYAMYGTTVMINNMTTMVSNTSYLESPLPATAVGPTVSNYASTWALIIVATVFAGLAVYVAYSWRR